MTGMLRVQARLALPNGDTGLSTFYFADDSTTAAACASAVTAFFTAGKTQFTGAGAAQVLPEVLAIESTTGQATGVFTVTESAVSGTQTGDRMPPDVQFLLRLTTGTFFNGRRIQGRLFLPGGTEDNNAADGRPATNARTAWNTAAAGLVAATPQWVVWSRAAGTVSPVQSAIISTEWSRLDSRRG